MGQYLLNLNTLGRALSKEALHLDDTFFQSLDQEDIKGGDVSVVVELTPVADKWDCVMRFSGEVTVLCDRCLEKMQERVEAEDSFRIELGESAGDMGDVVVVEEKTGMYDYSWRMFETIVLSLPIKRVHAEGSCDENMTDFLHSLTRGEEQEE